ncbi:MAG: Uncharacterized protein YmaE, partial [uncultured Thermomicrobiales bacterium]
TSSRSSPTGAISALCTATRTSSPCPPRSCAGSSPPSSRSPSTASTEPGGTGSCRPTPKLPSPAPPRATSPRSKATCPISARNSTTAQA